MSAPAVWTDFGGVLTPPIRTTLEQFCRRIGVGPGEMLAAMREVGRQFGTDTMAPLDTPLVTEREWCRLVETALLDATGRPVDLSGFTAEWFRDRESNEPWAAELRRIRETGVLVGMLSNMPPGWDEHWRRMVPPEDLFDEVVLSFQVGHRKPERAMFDLAAERAGVEPGRCLLVDDLPENCAAAVEAGWAAIHFSDTESAIAELRGWLGGQDR
ncbi:HAD-IA family hydrolase [Saccharopolyspora taberi]|uniref:Hydrolase of the HAD superfamily n=1 Tax=Saccharopolyspora taberi TaxID=60895 RepID=A0ABN3V7C1_9PSEU